MGLLEHLVIIGVHGNVGVDIAIARMHVQGHKNPRAQHPLVGGLEQLHDGRVTQPREKRAKRVSQLALPRDANATVLEFSEGGVRLCIEVREQVGPPRLHFGQCLEGLGKAALEFGRQILLGVVVVGSVQGQHTLGLNIVEGLAQCAGELEFV